MSSRDQRIADAYDSRDLDEEREERSSNLNPQQFSHNFSNGIHSMKPGEQRAFKTPQGKAVVNHYEYEPNGDDGTPARGYKKSGWSVSTPKGTKHFESSPYRKHEGFIRAYAAEQAVAHLRKSI